MITLTLQNDKKIYVNPANIDAIEPASEGYGYTKVYMASGIYSVEESAEDIQKAVDLTMSKEFRVDSMADSINDIGTGGKPPIKKQTRSKEKADG